jgi:hypothetical protein
MCLEKKLRPLGGGFRRLIQKQNHSNYLGVIRMNRPLQSERSIVFQDGFCFKGNHKEIIAILVGFSSFL